MIFILQEDSRPTTKLNKIRLQFKAEVQLNSLIKWQRLEKPELSIISILTRNAIFPKKKTTEL